MDKKYELTDETIRFANGTVLHRIRALRDVGKVAKAGDLGGWIEREENLSHDGESWVGRNAWVFGPYARVCENAYVAGQAMVFEHGCVSGNAIVCGNSRIFGHAHANENAAVNQDAWIYDNAWVFGNAIVSRDSRIHGDTHIAGDMFVTCSMDK